MMKKVNRIKPAKHPITANRSSMPQNGKKRSALLRRIFTLNNAFILLMFLFTMILLAYTDPSGQREPTAQDGSSLYGGITGAPTPSVQPGTEPAVFRKLQTEIDGELQVIHILELNLSQPGMEVFPVLAREGIFGFETLSDMNGRYQAEAAVNAGFNYAYGQPSGLVIQNGRILSGSMGYGRILLIKDQKAFFLQAPVKIWLDSEGRQLPVDRVNPYPAPSGILVFTPEYGPANRMEGSYSYCIARDNEVVSCGVAKGETDIPDDGFLIVDKRTEGSPLLEFTIGQKVTLQWDTAADQGYQCSGSLVENGKNVTRDDDAWGGNLQIQTPRTAVGLKDENTVVFLVADGRQPGYSKGLTGRQLADALISIGVTEAALLDGGASSEMIFGGEIVNRPSTGKERLLASGFIITVKGPSGRVPVTVQP